MLWHAETGHSTTQRSTLTVEMPLLAGQLPEQAVFAESQLSQMVVD